jgi:hypothetical protein
MPHTPRQFVVTTTQGEVIGLDAMSAANALQRVTQWGLPADTVSAIHEYRDWLNASCGHDVPTIRWDTGKPA